MAHVSYGVGYVGDVRECAAELMFPAFEYMCAHVRKSKPFRNRWRQKPRFFHSLEVDCSVRQLYEVSLSEPFAATLKTRDSALSVCLNELTDARCLRVIHVSILRSSVQIRVVLDILIFQFFWTSNFMPQRHRLNAQMHFPKPQIQNT